MKILKYILLITVSVLAAVACRDEDAVRFPELQTGVNARVTIDPAHSFYSLGEIETSYVGLVIYSQNKDIEELVYSATYTDVSAASVSSKVQILTVPGSAFSGGKATTQISAATLATAFGLSGGVTDLGGGDSFKFTTVAKLKDGRVIDASNSAPSITGGTNASFTTEFVLAVACPSFEITDAVGTYTLITDPGEWATSGGHEADIIAGPGDNQVTIKDALGYPQAFDMIITVDPITSAATVAKQETFDFDYWVPNSYGIGSTAGSGTFYSCAGFLTLNLVWTVDAGSFGNYKLEYQKN